ncbi:MBL fold metallo-hydrolase [Alicyclobacillus tolerans]|uniref:MBL fold metallo-hydrolase n=1 Tax=Alicyclobacillus tolerans TaxID=90970 RepID=UPI001F23A205|nr:MBL fold metallo-hydrolase [Alicyclobacillus tolerans]MCF8564304.1 MBL fold metallo-hydrolase [Alicyclobacillus tolerans]
MDSTYEHAIPMTSITSGAGLCVAPDLYSYTVQIANIAMIGQPDTANPWILIDAGMPRRAPVIIAEAEARFGPRARPQAIVLTHGHFDHVGALQALIDDWNVPVYAHEEELPYLTGERDYPPGNAMAGGGLVSTVSPFFPHHGIRIHGDLRALPSDGSVPFLDDWQWLHTPGHTPGHVSFFRPRDGALVAGDAFITVKQESLFHVLVQDIEFNGPPAYFTMDWEQAYASVKRLAELRPNFAVTGHGRPVGGEVLRRGLNDLVDRFPTTEVPPNDRTLHNHRLQ